VKPETLPSSGRCRGPASWLLVVLALAACEIAPSGYEWPDETDGNTTGEGSSTSERTDLDGTAGEASSSASSATTTDSTETGADELLPDEPVLELGFSQIKQFELEWAAVAGAERYVLLESVSGEPFAPIAEDVLDESISLTMSLHTRYRASYMLRACNEHGCTDSEPVAVASSLATAVGYFKASNTDASDLFGHAVMLSGDGNTLVVGAAGEDGGATGIDGDQADESATDAGAVYVFVRDSRSRWSQQAYIKASNTAAGDQFGAGFCGRSLALSWDGNTLAVGAWAESNDAVGIDGPPGATEANLSGAVYVLVRDAMGQWSQQAYVKASNTAAGNLFGAAVALSDDGDTLAVGAPYQGGDITELDGDQVEPGLGSGAVYVLVRSSMGRWSHHGYLQASNRGAGDEFGYGLALSGDGTTLAVGAPMEASADVGIGGDQTDDSAYGAGAVYVFVRRPMEQWWQQAYVKASNSDAGDRFGWSLALDLDGDTLAVGAPGEASDASRIGGNQDDDSHDGSGAAYVFVRDPMHRWSQQAYVKASNSDAQDRFGQSLALTHDGDMLAIGAHQERGFSSGLGGDQQNDAAGTAGAVYVLTRNAEAEWSQRVYVKAPNPSVQPLGDRFGWSLALSSSGHALAVGSPYEDSNATGISGDQGNGQKGSSGAVYLY